MGVSFFCASEVAILQNRKRFAKYERIRKAKHFKSPEDWDERYKLNPPKKHCHIRKVEVDEDAIVSCFETWPEDVPINWSASSKDFEYLEGGNAEGRF